MKLIFKDLSIHSVDSENPNSFCLIFQLWWLCFQKILRKSKWFLRLVFSVCWPRIPMASASESTNIREKIIWVPSSQMVGKIWQKFTLFFLVILKDHRCLFLTKVYQSVSIKMSPKKESNQMRFLYCMYMSTNSNRWGGDQSTRNLARGKIGNCGQMMEL